MFRTADSLITGLGKFGKARLSEELPSKQESDNPFEGFTCVGSGVPGAETGGSFFRLDGEIYFICGNGFGERSCYRAYRYGCFDKAEKLRCDIDDGGFRGWGSVFSVKRGTRRRIYWLTFDRQNGSEFNWTYGNLYCFEA